MLKYLLTVAKRRRPRNLSNPKVTPSWLKRFKQPPYGAPQRKNYQIKL